MLYPGKVLHGVWYGLIGDDAPLEFTQALAGKIKAKTKRGDSRSLKQTHKELIGGHWVAKTSDAM
jgi:hypothetical protein